MYQLRITFPDATTQEDAESMAGQLCFPIAMANASRAEPITYELVEIRTPELQHVGDHVIVWEDEDD